jgi:membrane-associated phospholipid phosphatase
LLTTEPTLSRSSYASLEAGGTAVLASTALKYLVGRQRPTSADSPRDVKPLSFTSSRDSFPSRHTTVAWAAITPFAVQYDAPWLYGLAGVTQLGRIASRQHWFSDTVAGSLLGTAIGQVFQRVGNDNSLRTSPQVSLNPEGVTFAWTFN